MKNLFTYIEESTWQEREQIGEELKKLYNDAMEDMQELFVKARGKRANSKERREYLESVQRMGAIYDIFDILRIPYEMSEKL